MTIEREQQSNVMSLPAEMYKNQCDGTITITISRKEQTPAEYLQKEGGKFDEKLKAEGISADDVVGCFSVHMKMEVGDLTDTDIIGCSPEQYLSNGLVAAILDAIREGLHEPRGINIPEAVDNATQKAYMAKSCADKVEVMDKLESLMLAISQPKGEA